MRGWCQRWHISLYKGTKTHVVKDFWLAPISAPFYIAIERTVKMTKNKNEESHGKKRYNFRVKDDTMLLIQKWYKEDNCTTMNEFVEKAISFYAGYVASERNQNYFPNIVISTMKSIMRDSENRQNRNLYRIAVELGMLMNVVAATHGIPEEALEKLRGDCEEEIKRINGTLSLDTAVKWQG